MTARKLSISVPPDVEETIKAAAAGEGKPVSAWLAEAATEKAHAAALQEAGRAAARELVAEYEKEHGPLPAASRQRARQFLAEAEPVNPVETSGGLILLWCHLRLDGCGGLVDPDSGGQPRWFGAAGGTGRGWRRRPAGGPAARRAWIWVAVPSWTDAGVCRPMPEWRCSLL